MSRRSLAAALVALLLAVTAATVLGASSVKVGDNYFVRPSGVPVLKAKPGVTITFRFAGRNRHTVSVASGPSTFSTSPMSSGTFKTPRLKAGTYVIYCKLHGRGDMRMKLKVAPAA